MKDRSGDALVGLAALGCGVTGTVGIVSAVWALVAGEFSAAGLSLAAAALAFGLLANGLLRD
jgi:hypothetical protein